MGKFVDRLLTGRQLPAREEMSGARKARRLELSQREAELARLLSQGYSNRQLADALAMAPDTVKWHLKNIFGKLGAANRTQAVLRLQDLGLGQVGAADTRTPATVLPERVV